MAIAELQPGNGVRSSWRRCLLKHLLAMLAVLSAVGVTLYVTGAGKSFTNSLEHLIKAKWQKLR